MFGSLISKSSWFNETYFAKYANNSYKAKFKGREISIMWEDLSGISNDAYVLRGLWD